MVVTAAGVVADPLDPPAGYYDGITATSGPALMTQLESLMTVGHQLTTYGDARYILDESDADPNNPNNVLHTYSRRSVSGAWVGNSNNFGPRGHVWPTSRRPDSAPSNSTRNVGSDLHMLKPLDQSTNSSRGDDPFGLLGGTGSHGNVGSTYYYPGNADAGDMARIIFYGGTRWRNIGLKVVDGPGNLYVPTGAGLGRGAQDADDGSGYWRVRSGVTGAWR